MADERTGAGERRAFSPMAGVEVELNSRSSASRTDGGHGLDLIGGEVFVSVSDAGRPFRVKAGGATFTAEQASFNVQAFADDICVTCVQGSLLATRGKHGERLGAGRELVLAPDGEIREGSADALRLAWRRGLLILRRTPVAEAIPQINRYFSGRLVLTDRSKSEWPVTGVFHIDQIELAVVQLQQLLNVKATRLPGGVVLLG
jgi:transmembrane sensor